MTNQELKNKHCNDIIALAKSFASSHRGYGKMFASFDDYVQELILAAVRALNKFDESKGKFSTYLYKCFRNWILVRYRKFKNEIQTISLNGTVNYLEGNDIKLEDILPEKINFEERLLNHLECTYLMRYLSEETKQHYLEGKTFREISEEEGITYRGVQLRIRSNLRVIRRILSGKSVNAVTEAGRTFLDQTDSTGKIIEQLMKDKNISRRTAFRRLRKMRERQLYTHQLYTH